MKLADLTQKVIEQFAGTKIFARGYDYYESENVSRLTYDPDTESISAEVAGNTGDYDVEIEQVDGDIQASCNCPFDGYPCKHIVAVLLSFINHRREHLREAKKAKSRNAAIEARIRKLSTEELAGMVMTCARRYPDFQGELMVRFEPDRKQTLDALLKQVARAFPSIESRSYSTDNIARDLKRVLQSVESAEKTIGLDVNWAVADSILNELNEYGMNDDALEEVLFDVLQVLKDFLVGKVALAARKREIIDRLMYFYNWGNCGVVDIVYDTVMDLCSEKQDYQAVIEKLESRNQSSSYIRGLLADLYQLIGDERAELAVLERELRYGMDYWSLAEYWLRRGNRDKATRVVEEGIEKGEGRKQELYDFLQQDFEKRGDYVGLANLLERKAQRNDLLNGTLRADPIYLSLRDYYRLRDDYGSLLKLLQLCLKRNEIDFGVYREAKEALKENDRAAFEKEMISRLRREQKDRKSTWSLGPSQALKTLAEIHAYKEDLDQLFEVVKGEHELLVKYEDRLLSLHSSHYLSEYRARAESLIAERGRGNYLQAVEYLKKVRTIYRDMLKRSEEWDRYIRGIRENNKTLRALHEELRKARLIA
ncbi:MAG: SWIM zinc finger family protein [Syntrophobacteraceae bacterium]|jgi:hypothetical protein